MAGSSLIIALLCFLFLFGFVKALGDVDTVRMDDDIAMGIVGIESVERVHNYEVFVVVMLVQRIRYEVLHKHVNDAVDVANVVLCIAMFQF